MYKGTNPTCHDFNLTTATSETAALLVGFSTGQVQLIDPIKKELSKVYNEEVRHPIIFYSLHTCNPFINFVLFMMSAPEILIFFSAPTEIN